MPRGHPPEADPHERAHRIIRSVAEFAVKTVGREAAVSLLIDEACEVRDEIHERDMVRRLMHGTKIPTSIRD